MHKVHRGASVSQTPFATRPMPAEEQPIDRMQGHWVLARAGKTVLRPGGLGLTRQMLDALDIGGQDSVVELAPGMGATAELTLQCGPRRYLGIERDQAALGLLEEKFRGTRACFAQGCAEQTRLPDQSATVVYSEALLSMQSPLKKEQIVTEAARLLVRGGRYGMHELCLLQDDISEETRREINSAMSLEIHTGVTPLTRAEWRTLLEQCGLKVVWESSTPMHLLEPGRILRDEGLAGAARIACRIGTDSHLRRRVLGMRRLFHTYRDHLGAISLIAQKP